MRFIRFLLPVVLGVIITSCGTYHKLLKSDNNELKYQKGINYFYDKEYNRAISLLSSVMSPFAGSLREDTIVFYLAKSLYNSKDYEQAGEFMNSFRSKFNRSQFLEESEYIYAMSFYKQSGSEERDQTVSFRAISAFTEYLNRYPESIKKEDIYLMIDELNNKIYQKQFNNAALYHKLGKYNAAITALRSVLKNYPEIPQKEQIMYLICKSWYDYAYNSIESKQLDRYLKMMDAYYSFKSNYPESTKYLKELTNMYEKAEAYSKEHGFQAQAIDKNRVNIEERKERIAELKNKRFYTQTKAERQKLSEDIKLEKIAIAKDREIIKENKAELRVQKKEKEKLKKQKDALATMETVTQTGTAADATKEAVNTESKTTKKANTENKANKKDGK